LKPTIDIENLGFDQGAHLLIKRALQKIPAGSELIISGFDDNFPPQLSAWCRTEGHAVSFDGAKAIIVRGTADAGRWDQAQLTGPSVSETAQSSWGLAARGAKVEAGTPSFPFRHFQKFEVWSDNISELYSQALSAQWNPNEAIDWSVTKKHSDESEEAIVQIMTYLIENENLALIVPTRFLGQLHPHFREVQALMALQIADESRHVEVFTRRVHQYGHEPALSTVGGQASLKTILDEPDFSTAQFLLSVLGEGTFVNLLQFLAEVAPDPLTKQIAQLTARDESRHVAFGMGHLLYQLQTEPRLKEKLSAAVIHRHEHLAHTSGLNSEVFDALILLAAGDVTPSAIEKGYKRVQILMQEMAEGRRLRLTRLGFSPKDADHLANLHTRNFM
jgi:hypothetical protein